MAVRRLELALLARLADAVRPDALDASSVSTGDPGRTSSSTSGKAA